MRKIILWATILLLMLHSQNSHAQLFASQTTRAYNLLKENKLNDAHDEFIKILSKDSVSFVCKYGLAQILQNESYGKYNLEMAYNFLTQIQSHIIVIEDLVSWNTDISVENKKEIDKNKITPDNIKSLKDSIIYKLYKTAIQNKDIKQLKNFVENHHDSKYLNDAVSILSELEYFKAKNSKSVSALKNYIKDYPYTTYLSSSWSEIHRLVYDSICLINLKDSYTNFISEYPNAEQTKDARLQIYKLSFDESTINNTTESYLAFLRNYPNAPQKKECYNLLKGKLYFTLDGINYHLKDSTLEVVKSYLQENIVIPESILVNGVSFSVSSIGDSALIYVNEEQTSLTVESIQLPSSITTISDYAFVWHTANISKVFISAHLEKIGFKSFNSAVEYSVDEENRNYSSLDGVLYNKDKTKLIRCPSGKTSIQIPISVTNIAPHAFENSSLMHVIFPENVKVIGEYAFRYSKALTSIQLNEGLDSIHTGAFEACWKIKKLDIPESVSFVADKVFFEDTKITVKSNNKHYTILEGVLFDKSVSTLKRFPSSYMGKYVIPETVKKISDYAFYKCDNLFELQIPNSVEYIGKRAFALTGIKSITIPSSVKKLDFSSFYGCQNLTTSNFDKELSDKISKQNKIESIQDSLFSDFYFNNPRLKQTAQIEGALFRNNQQLIIEKNIVNQNDNSKSKISIETSWSKDDQQDVSPDILSRRFVLDNFTDYEKCEIPNNFVEIENKAFLNFETVKLIIIPASVKKIGESAFSNCRSLKHIDIPNTIDSIKSETFSYCEELLTIDIPNSVTYIGDRAFDGCKSLTKIYIPASVRHISPTAFGNINAKIELDNQNQYFSQKDGVIFDKKQTVVIWGMKNIEGKITLPSTVQIIGDYAFSGCKKLSEIVCSQNMTKIGSYAFQECVNLQSILLPQSIEVIDEYAFSFCSKLKTIKLPQKLKILSKGLFEECNSLKSVYIPSSIEIIEQFSYESTFRKDLNDIGAYTYTLPIEYVIDEKNNLFKNQNGCIYDKKQTILYYCKPTISGTFAVPNTVKEISDNAFLNCNLIDIVKISTPSIFFGDLVFEGCYDSLKHIEIGALKITLNQIDHAYIEEFIFEPND